MSQDSLYQYVINPFFGFIRPRKNLHNIGENRAISVEELIAAPVEDFSGFLSQSIGDKPIGRNREVGAGAAAVLHRVFSEDSAQRLFAGNHLVADVFRETTQLNRDRSVFYWLVG